MRAHQNWQDHQLQFVLDNAEHEDYCCFYQPDRRAGRGKKIQVSPVKKIAENFELNIYQPTTLSIEHEKKIIFDLDPDIILNSCMRFIAKKYYKNTQITAL